jgi:fructose-1,6-bisphosphatase
MLADRPPALEPVTGMQFDDYPGTRAITGLDPTGDLADVLTAVARAITAIADQVGRAPLSGADASLGSVNVQGETQVGLDVVSNDLLLGELSRCTAVGAVVSEEMPEAHVMAREGPPGPYLVTMDPLDGSSNVGVNIPDGTNFSVLRPKRPGTTPDLADFLQPGRDQVCAGFALYGPATVLVLATREGTVGFTLDPARRVFVLTQPRMQIPETAREFAINASNERFWAPPVRRFVAECLAGRSGPRAADYNMRWVASLVAETYRILTRGGVFLYPADSRSGTGSGRLRLLYECNPVSFVVEQAGGAASTGRGRVLDLPPTGLHQRVPLVFGSRAEVDLVERYHLDEHRGADLDFSLFNSRTLFRSR